ncbi:unnamed protein product, partial [Oppiella nova]
EFVTGFITYYNLLRDPYQLRNSIYDLELTTLEDLRRQLNKLKSCAGAKLCTLPARHIHNHIIAVCPIEAKPYSRSLPTNFYDSRSLPTPVLKLIGTPDNSRRDPPNPEYSRQLTKR